MALLAKNIMKARALNRRRLTFYISQCHWTKSIPKSHGVCKSVLTGPCPGLLLSPLPSSRKNYRVCEQIDHKAFNIGIIIGMQGGKYTNYDG